MNANKIIHTKSLRNCTGLLVRMLIDTTGNTIIICEGIVMMIHVVFHVKVVYFKNSMKPIGYWSLHQLAR